MNLIEQLGGYEKAKKHLKSMRDNNVLMSGHSVSPDCRISFYDFKLDKALLEYRRHHNIFEVGDKVVLKNSRFGSCSDSVYEVVRINKKHLLYELDCGWCGYSYYLQHATDKEIKAGHRL